MLLSRGFALADAGIESIMVNCNPETVSTDPDTSDRLYFEPLTKEDVLTIIEKEQEDGELLGVIVQFGGQTPLKLANDLEAAGIPILGTSPDAIDLAEDRDRFKALLDELGLKQPPNGIARTAKKPRRLRKKSAIQSSFAPLMCWVAAAWKSCATRRTFIATSTKPLWSPATARFSSTGI